SLADIVLGVFVLVRRRSALALQGMVALSLLYLAAATLTAPSLWIDPLGPLVKVLPSIVMALVALATLEDR
ncbi:oxidoreductase, partial [Salmonella enterica subsp. enterica serovar Virchow]|nr:oxidoreductase [Salmonella enterica subsp. enterica serovar Virchow]